MSEAEIQIAELHDEQTEIRIAMIQQVHEHLGH